MIDFVSNFSDTPYKPTGVRLPEIIISEKHLALVGLKSGSSNYDFLRALCLTGFKDLRLVKTDPKYATYTDRVKYELGIFQELGFVDYVLMVWDVINYCKENSIPVGPGRGSACGSLVLYLIGVTKIDPIKYNLFFERFVSKTRAKKTVVDGVTYLDGSLMCDVDMDICYYRRQEVLAYIDQRYTSKTAKILTFNTLSSKILIKEVGKTVGGKADSDMTKVTGMIPKTFGIVAELPQAYKEVPEFKTWCDENPLVFNISKKLHGLVKNKGVHPSGVLVSYAKLEDSCPTELTSDKAEVSSVDMAWVSVANVKLDVLGLRSVSVVNDVCRSVGIEMKDIDLNDPLIYLSLQDLKSPHGLFQIEADLAFEVLKKVMPRSLEQLSDVLALARPGAMAHIDQYAAYSNNGVYDAENPFFDDILKPTGGICLYQEQLMRMVNKIGFSLEDSEQVRRCVGKKKVEEMALWEDKISKKIEENRLDPKIGKTLWDIAKASANYQFCKSHSVAYAALSALTIYLKFKYPQQFFLSLLKMTKNEPDPVQEIYKIQKEMSAFGIKLLRPDLLKSDMQFSIVGRDIRFGLMSIKGISEGSLDSLLKFRTECGSKKMDKFELFESANKSKINVGVLSSLIQAGCFETHGASRSYAVYQAQLWGQLTDREKVIAKTIGEKHEFNLTKTLGAMKTMKTATGKEVIKETRVATITKDCRKYADIFEVNKKNEPIANWWYETKLLGYSFSSSLKDVYKEQLENFMTVKEAKSARQRSVVYFGGLIFEKSINGQSKKGSKYIKMFLRDETEQIVVMVFNERAEAMATVPAIDDLVLVKGTIQDGGVVFADIVAPQSAKIYTKLCQLKG